MVLSASTGFAAYGPWNTFGLQITWSATQNIAENYSDVKATLTLRSSNNGSYLISYPSSASITINGEPRNWSGNVTLNPWGTTEVFSTTVRVPHNGDGGKRFGITGAFSNGITNSGSVSGEWDLNGIPRSSSMTLAAGSEPLEFGKPFAFEIQAASSTFFHYIQYNGRVIVSGAKAGRVSVTLPLEDAAEFPNDASGLKGFRLITSSSSTGWDPGLIGFKDYSYSINVPKTVVPTISTISFKETNPDVIKLMGTSNILVATKSIVKLEADAQGNQGSTIVKYEFQLNGHSFSTVTGNSVTVDLSKTDVGSGNVSVKVLATDTRGITAEKYSLLLVRPYSPPQLVNVGISRLANPSTTLRIVKEARVAEILVGADRNVNTYTVTIRTKLTTASTFTVSKTENNTSAASVDISSFESGKSWDVEVILQDAFGSDRVISTVPTLAVLLDLYRDEGIGIGKMRENGVLDVFGDFYHKGKYFHTGEYRHGGGNMFHNNEKIQQYEVTNSESKNNLFFPNDDLNNTGGAALRSGLFMRHGLKNRLAKDGDGSHGWVYVTQQVHNDRHLLQEMIDFNGINSGFRVKTNNEWKPWNMYAIQEKDVTFKNLKVTDIYKKSIDLGHGLRLDMIRSGNVVCVKVGIIYTNRNRKASNYVHHDDVIPVGFRPAMEMKMILFPVVGQSPGPVERNLSMLYLYENGKVLQGVWNEDSPIEFHGSVSYVTMDDLPAAT